MSADGRAERVESCVESYTDCVSELCTRLLCTQNMDVEERNGLVGSWALGNGKRATWEEWKNGDKEGKETRPNPLFWIMTCSP